jgi:hypothetical protein
MREEVPRSLGLEGGHCGCQQMVQIKFGSEVSAILVDVALALEIGEEEAGLVIVTIFDGEDRAAGGILQEVAYQEGCESLVVMKATTVQQGSTKTNLKELWTLNQCLN